MNGKKRLCTWIIFILMFLLTPTGVFYPALADHDDHDQKRRYQKREQRHSEDINKQDVATVDNPAYMENCGACHFAYQPGLLSSVSWDKILKGLSDHFGERIELDSESMNAIAEYLKAYAANNSSAKLSNKIMKSVGTKTVFRITQVPYIQRKHREIDPQVFARESIGSFSNCAACHKTAENGIYDDDAVVIPE